MNKQEFKQVQLNEIIPNPDNPRKRFEGKKFDELVASIRQKGVLEPILLRPIDGAYMLVAGERRWRAACEVAKENGGTETHAIPALVRELSDDDAFDIMTIENLQREDLTEIEEARAFRTYVKKKGDDAIPDLADRIGVKAKYIRRRIRVLVLPAKLIKWWDQGVLTFSHLEEFMRLNKKDELKDMIEWFEEQFLRWEQPLTISHLRRKISEISPELETARFDRAVCISCHFNSKVQKALFGMDTDYLKCLNRTCFIKKQTTWLDEHWEEQNWAEANGWRYREEFAWNDFEWIGWKKLSQKCKGCKDLVILVDLNGQPSANFMGGTKGQACIGDKPCFQAEQRIANKITGTPSKPEPKNHGTEFREAFYAERLPQAIGELAPDDDKALRAILMAMINLNWDVQNRFCEIVGLPTWKQTRELIVHITGMELADVKRALRDLSVTSIMNYSFGAYNRHQVGRFLGISLKEEWQIHEEYLKKKTIREILEIGETLGILKDEKARAFLHEKLLKKPGRYDQCKKTELIKVFLESGVDLAGRVPEEILIAEK
jgi:ParB/RepB/Spo0J family partition protein